MSYLDKPTDAQLTAIHSWGKWKLDAPLLNDSLKWLETHANRQQVSKEMSRIRALYYDHKLDKTTYFDSPIWVGYKTTDN